MCLDLNPEESPHGWTIVSNNSLKITTKTCHSGLSLTHDSTIVKNSSEIKMLDKYVEHEHGGHIGHKKVHPRNYLSIFYSFELELCRMVELCILKNPMFFVF